MSKPKSSWVGRIVGTWKLLRDTEQRTHMRFTDGSSMPIRILPDFHRWELECIECGARYSAEFKRIAGFSCPACNVEKQFAEAQRLHEIARLNKRGQVRQLNLFIELTPREQFE